MLLSGSGTDVSLLCPALQRQRPQPFQNTRRPSAPHPVTPTSDVTMLSNPSLTYGDLFDTTLSVSESIVDPGSSAKRAASDRWIGWSYYPEFGIPVTPATPKRSSHATTVPRSTLRRRPLTEDRAYAEMLQCVEASATHRTMSMETLSVWNMEREGKLKVSTHASSSHRPELGCHTVFNP